MTYEGMLKSGNLLLCLKHWKFEMSCYNLLKKKQIIYESTIIKSKIPNLILKT